MPDHDLLLKNGHVVDPAAEVDGVRDVAFYDGKVVACEKGIDPATARNVRDVTGKIVTPGLIDMHTHVYWGGTSLGIDVEDYCRQSAVTTAVDTGSTGPGNFAGFRKHVIEPSPVRILVYLHVSHAGIFAFTDRIMVGESEELRLMDPRTAVEVANGNRDVIVGIKVRLGRHASGIHGMAPFEHALQVAEETGLPLMVHIDEPPPSYVEVVNRLRPGDVLTHCFRPFPNTPVSPDGSVRPEVLEARARGVLFDIGHGMGSFAFKTARQMLAAGFYPDTISSDVHAQCINGPAYDQVTTMSKFLCLGMPWLEVVRASTEHAAKALNRPELGTLKPGSLGDAAILTIENGAFDYRDVTGEGMVGDQRIAVQGVVLNGQWWSDAAEPAGG